MDYYMDDSGFAGVDVLEHLRNSDDDLWNKFLEDEKQLARLVAQGKRWTHTCPECGRTFQNDEPEKGIYAMSAEEKNFRNYLTNGNRSCVTWNGNLLDGASPPLRASAAYLRAKGATLTPKTLTNGSNSGICAPQMAKA
jgi:hypothetical protein